MGAINWLPDIRRWAGVVSALLDPGGVLYMKEVHPFSWVFGDDDLTVESDYFAHRNDYDEPGTYTDPDAPTVHNRTEEWQHPLGEVVNAVIGAGLTLELLGEHDHQAYRQWPFMEKDGSRLPDARRERRGCRSCTRCERASRPSSLRRVPEGDTIHYAARRVGAALVGSEIEAIETPQPRHALRPLAGAARRPRRCARSTRTASTCSCASTAS